MLNSKRPFIPLSWEHHHGLSLVWRIRRGLERRTPSEIILSYVLPFWDRNVVPHFDLEETVLLPVVPREEPMVRQMLEEHRLLRLQAEQLRTGEPETAGPKSLKSFSDLLERHIRFEERKIFPWIAKTLPAETREAVEKRLHEKFHRLVEPETTVFWE